jgi:uncharacterized protein YndB with AHSA1/START domain
MERKTKVQADPGQHDLTITREFDLPVGLLFKAHAEPPLIEQWMGTKVLKFEGRPHGGWQFETRDATGNPVFRANGVFHAFDDGRKIIRTFQMEGAPFGVQLDVLDFEALTQETSRLTMHSIYESVAQRDQLLKMPFAQGINMAHNRLQDLISKLARP